VDLSDCNCSSSPPIWDTHHPPHRRTSVDSNHGVQT
jgi:hypothetical protein